jgi:hypothetical protein
VAWYQAPIGVEILPPTEEMFTIFPAPRVPQVRQRQLGRPGQPGQVHLDWYLASSRVVSSIAPYMPNPALLTSTSIADEIRDSP